MRRGITDPRVIQHNAEAGTTEYFHYDQHTGGFTTEIVQNEQPIVEHAKQILRNATSDWKGDMRHVASIPLVILEQLRKDGVLADQKRFRQWLNDRDNRVFRTHTGNV